MQAFSEKVAVVTGAASGIGLETARQLCAAGAIVVAADLDAPRLEEACAALAEAGGRISGHVVDVADTESLRGLIDGAVEAHGRIDYLFNIAGIGGKGGEVRDMQPEDWTRILRVNLHSVIHGSSFAYAHMRAQRAGHIVNMASAAGLLGAPQMIPYGTTKAAVVAFSRDLRIEAEAFGVRVTVLCPGFVESRIFENTLDGPVDVKAVKGGIPFAFVPTDRAVTTMLRGVLANKAIVTLPGYVGVLWLLRRMFPVSLDKWFGRKQIADLRRHRRPEG